MAVPTGSSTVDTISDKWTFIPLFAKATGLIGGGVPETGFQFL